MSRRGAYLGGHRIYHFDPRGGTPIPDTRPEQIKNLEASERSRQHEREFDRIELERQALRRILITGGDEVALGCKSSGWPQYEKALRDKLLSLKKKGIRRADDLASTLNRLGFKTGSGQRWTPRLVNIAKMKLFNWSPNGRSSGGFQSLIRRSDHGSISSNRRPAHELRKIADKATKQRRDVDTRKQARAQAQNLQKSERKSLALKPPQARSDDPGHKNQKALQRKRERKQAIEREWDWVISQHKPRLT